MITADNISVSSHLRPKNQLKKIFEKIPESLLKSTESESPKNNRVYGINKCHSSYLLCIAMCIRHYVKHFTCIISFNPHNITQKF
jgi:hypothetical protein